MYKLLVYHKLQSYTKKQSYAQNISTRQILLLLLLSVVVIGIFHWVLGILFNFVSLTPHAMYEIKLGTTYLPSSARQNDGTESHISLIFTCLKLPTTVCVLLQLYSLMLLLLYYTIWQNTKKCSILNDFFFINSYLGRYI